MEKINELKKSQEIDLSSDFYECLQHGIIFNPRHQLNNLLFQKMSTDIIIQHWNHSKFLPMLFESFDSMDKKDIDCHFIITDSGSNEDEINNVNKILDNYKNKFKITFLIHDLNEIRDKFNKDNIDGTFHGFPYISNSALNFCNNDVHILCDSSNLVNENWLRGLCSLHYKHSNLIVKSLGADFTAESTIQLENGNFNKENLKLPHTFYGFEAGRGFGWSIKTENIKELGGFRHLLSSCGGVDDDFIYRAKLNNIIFVGHSESFAIHRIHDAGYRIDEGNKPRLPNWAYKQLKRIYITEKSTEPKIKFESITPIKIYKNYVN